MTIYLNCIIRIVLSSLSLKMAKATASALTKHVLTKNNALKLLVLFPFDLLNNIFHYFRFARENDDGDGDDLDRTYLDENLC